LREKREEILKQLREDDAEKAKIQQDLQLLTKRLAQVNDSIARKVRPKGLPSFTLHE
jgi:Sjoegren syndrome nuclear autoantigen 1